MDGVYTGSGKDVQCRGVFFGRTLHADLGIPVGLNHSSWGGTPVQAWPRAEQLETIPEYKPIIENIRTSGAAVGQYAWSNTASAGLFNKEGLPASSFRSDVW